MTDEGDPCIAEDCGGKLHFPPVKNCSCHINPPCCACTNVKLTCDSCGLTYEEMKSDGQP